MTVPGPDALMALMGWAGPTPEFTLLATDTVRLVGDPVAVVVAESRYLAEDGCELVEVEYDDLPPVMDAAFALDPGSPPLFANLGDNIARTHSRHEFGDVSATFANADRVSTSTSTCTGTRTCPWRDAAASRVTTPTPVS
jgi:Aerobic-type carbon monoxide dehydrogenase, large subunit CoxL/CutL homologs